MRGFASNRRKNWDWERTASASGWLPNLAFKSSLNIVASIFSFQSFVSLFIRDCFALSGDGPVAACLPIHLFVVYMAHDLAWDTQRKIRWHWWSLPAVLKYSWDQIIAAAHYRNLMTETDLIEFQGIVIKTIRRTNDFNFFPTIISLSFFCNL